MRIIRTTVTIDDHLLASAKRRARGLGLTLGQLVERALRREMASDDGKVGPPVPTFTQGTGVRPGVDMTSTRGLLEALDDNAPLEHLR